MSDDDLNSFEARLVGGMYIGWRYGQYFEIPKEAFELIFEEVFNE